MDHESQSPPPSSVEEIIDYPTSDGKPMGETPVHRRIMAEVIETLEDRYEDDPSVYVSGNMLLYYERGNKHKHYSPDVQVTFGIPKEKKRKYYLLWEELKGPDVVFEITSSSTHEEDLEIKYNFYLETLKVSEYFLFDPHGEYLTRQIEGYRLVDGRYERIMPANGRWESRLLNLELTPRGEKLWLYDKGSGKRLLSRLELKKKAEKRAATAERRAATAVRRAESMDRRVATLEADLERLRKELAQIQSRVKKAAPKRRK